MNKPTVTQESSYRGYPLLEYDGPDKGFYTKILDRLIDRLEFQLATYGKVLVVWLVAKYPKELDANKSNQSFQYFIEEYRRKLMSHSFAPHYVWVREQHRSLNPHYHFVLFLDANRIPYFNYLWEVKQLWNNAIVKFNPGIPSIPFRGLIHKSGFVYHGKQINHGLSVSSMNRALQDEAIRISSYIAKISTKDGAPFNCNNFHASQLAPKQKGIDYGSGS